MHHAAAAALLFELGGVLVVDLLFSFRLGSHEVVLGLFALFPALFE